MTKPNKLNKIVKQELWRRGEIDYMYHPVQKIFRKTIDEAPKNVTIIMNECARQLGKSAFGVLWGIEQCLKRDNITVLLVAPNKSQGYEIADGLFDELTQDAPDGLIKKTSSKLRWQIGKSKFVIGGAINPETLRGVRADDVILEEPRDIESSKLEKLIRGTVMPKLLLRGGRVIVNTTTPDSIDHYVVTTLAERAIQSNSYNRFTIYDNPMLTKDMLEFAIRESGGEHSTWFRREYLCERITDMSNLVIPSFTMDHVTKDKLVRPNGRWLSGDIGGSRDKTVLHVLGISSLTNKIIVVKEKVFESGTPITEIGNSIIQLCKKYEIHESNRWVDAHGQTVVDLNLVTHCNIKLPPKQDVQSAIKALNNAFYNNEIEINEDLRFTVKSLRSGYWNPKGTDMLRTEELGHCDAIMSLVYGFRCKNLVFKEPSLKEKLHIQSNNISLAPDIGKVGFTSKTQRMFKPKKNL